MATMTLNQFVEYAVQDISLEGNESTRLTFLKQLRDNFSEAKRLVYYQIHHWVVTIKNELKIENVEISDFDDVSHQIATRLKVVFAEEIENLPT